MTHAAKPPVVGIAGWKKSGKTTLITRLIDEFTRRGLKVASVKHAHHAFQIDAEATDSAKHRGAGAISVAIVSASRWAVVNELAGAPEPSLETVVATLPPCDLILVEGYKRAPIRKIEARRGATLKQQPLAPDDASVIAIAADHAADGAGRPVFGLDDIAGLADFLAATLGLGAGAAEG